MQTAASGAHVLSLMKIITQVCLVIIYTVYIIILLV